MQKGRAELEQRSGQDRRQRPTPITGLFFNGRRELVRRRDERNKPVVFDKYKPSLFIGIVIILLLSLTDALLTLLLLSRGAEEINPVMRYYLQHGMLAFILVKYGLTALSLLILLLVKSALSPGWSSGLFMAFALFFAAVVAWELYLLSISALPQAALF